MNTKGNRAKHSRFSGQVAAVTLTLALAAALWLVLRTWNGPAGTSSSHPTAAATHATASSEAPHHPGVVEVLASLPPKGARVELDAFYAGATAASLTSGGPPPPSDQVVCPAPWPSYLTDQPFAATLEYLNTTTGNLLPPDAAWLVAATPEQTHAGGYVMYPMLPYHARLRGYFGEPAFATCEHAGRIFVVERVVQVYEQDPPDPAANRLQVPRGYATWPRDHDAKWGYSLPYPPDWQLKPLDDSTLRLTGPSWPDHPVVVRVYAGETHYDQYETDPTKTPPLLRGSGWGVFEQDLPVPAGAGFQTQGLAGYSIEPDADQAGGRTVAVLFSGSGRTYELALTYPIGFSASQALLNIYTGIVEGFRLDVDPGPTPTAPVQQSLGAGPFLTQAQAVAAAEQHAGGPLSLLSADLVSEAQARGRAQACNTFMGHPDGVWLLVVHGQFEGQARRMQLFLDATSGEQLCGEETPNGS